MPLNFCAAGSWPLSIQMSGEISDNWVAFASRFFEALALEHPNVAAAVSDEPAPLQTPRSRGDAGAPDSKHLGKKFLGQIELVALNPVLHHEKPPSQTFLNLVQPVAGGKLAQDKSMTLRELEDAPEERTGGEHYLL